MQTHERAVPDAAPTTAGPAPVGRPPLGPAELCRRCDPAQVPFDSTAEVRDGDEPLGHDRALEALALGVSLRRDGYNVFALGPPGVGKHDTVGRVLRQQAAADPVPCDWVYVHDFDEPHRPRCMELPAGRAADLGRDMARLVDELRAAVPAVLASDEHRNRRKLADQEFRQRQEKRTSITCSRRGTPTSPTSSALGSVPVRQGIAVTGSVDQHGSVQPVGGLNEKIEGFFDACVARGLTGRQGVVIPGSNRSSLMLRDDVVAAAAAGRFQVWAVDHVDEAVEVLTGIPAGAPEASGAFAAGSVNRRVADRLRALAEESRRWGAGGARPS